MATTHNTYDVSGTVLRDLPVSLTQQLHKAVVAGTAIITSVTNSEKRNDRKSPPDKRRPCISLPHRQCWGSGSCSRPPRLGA